ncbi:sensor histidine kinase [Brevibacillus fluminis]|uniref:histidine kinase n=1 Tax=Brevibacillus fluminis TaxID=511487 RepID=A0A3M8CS49_9BACL|nr:ATP-binding protein [Brevibacillus fluminis]RNB78524.1 sensor histidine kinase [Brevibacillus fluminis]
MKIKRWLMITYLVVMLLPLAAVCSLYLLISAFDERRDFLEYFEVSNKMSSIEQKLQDPSLYQIQPSERYRDIRSFAGESVKITLYNADGITLFSSTEDGILPSLTRVQTDFLLGHLYEMRKTNRTYSLKKPVFTNNRMVGIYEITLARAEWIEGVQVRTFWLISSLILFFILLYLSVVFLLNRKLNRPIAFLMKQMTAFAHDKPVPSLQHHGKDEISELLVHFEKMRELIDIGRLELATTQQEKEYMIASLSHDLKTPLTSIRAYAESLATHKGVSPQERDEYVAILFSKIDYMQQILDDLTMYTTLRSSQQSTNMVRVDGGEFFDMLLSGYDELCKQHRFQLTTFVAVTSEYQVDVQQMLRLVDNLMSNAIRFTLGEESIWLAALSAECPLPDWVFPPFQQAVTEWRRDGVILLVQNVGEAIPLQQQDRLFEPFFQADPARTKAGARGSGLGLSIAKMIMDRHQGDIRIWSANGYGTLVACYLPIMKG